MKESDTSEY